MILVLVLLNFCNFLPASTLYFGNRFTEAYEFLGAKNVSGINTHSSELNAHEAAVRSEDPVIINTLPVGQGDATIIQCPQSQGKQFSLVDMGSTSPSGAMNREKYVLFIKTNLFGYGYRLRHIFLTHPDSDHLNYYDGLLPVLVERYQSLGQTVTIHLSSFDNWFGLAVQGDFLHTFLDYIWGYPNVFKVTQYNPDTDNVIDICQTEGEGDFEGEIQIYPSDVKMMIIAADLGRKANELSMVMSLSYIADDGNGGKMLFMGDFEGITQYLLLLKNEKYRQYLEADVVMVPHHGSDTKGNGNPLFYEVVNARHAIISSNIKDEGNRHPRLNTLASICDGFYMEEEEPYYPYGLCDVKKACSNNNMAQGHSYLKSAPIGKGLDHFYKDSEKHEGCRTTIHQTTKMEAGVMQTFFVVTELYHFKKPIVKSNQVWYNSDLL